MAKALVIKGADFETNRVAVIEFEGDHTTAISISPESIEFSSMGETETLVATVTPSTSVDPVIWTTSNSAVATVSNGVVTSVGTGSCTITATSGSYSDTCSVNVNVYLSGVRMVKTLTDPVQSGNNSFTKTLCNIGVTNTTYDDILTIFGVDALYGDNLLCGNMTKNVASTGYDMQIIQPNEFESGTNQKRIYDNAGGYPKPMKLPNGATKIKCIGPSDQYGARAMFFKSTVRALNTNEDINGSGYYCAYRERYEPTAADYTWVYQNNLEFNVPEEYDSVVVVWKTDPNDAQAVLPVNMTAEQLAEFKVLAL